MRALIVTSMWPTAAAPARGSFVRDQVQALRSLGGVDVEVFAFPPKGYARAARDLLRRYRGERFDVVHAHFGLTAWPALAVRRATRVVTLHGTDLRHPRSRRITRAALPRYDLVAAVSPELAREVPGAGTRRRVAVLPCGVALDRFRVMPRRQARERLGLDPGGRVLLFPADPARPAKRGDRARELADATGAQLLSLGRVDPSDVPSFVNAADAVVVPSEHEGFGLAVLEALACDVPVVATPVGNHPTALEGIDGTLCAPYDPDAWRAALEPHLAAPDPRVDGRARAALWSAERMARRVLEAWIELSGAPLYSPAEAPATGALCI
ncbi:MAG TPA: glycosyltransferase [Solirubrobacteraceae bacterium]|nr:glycosyltransferase [Solirubrobacteraceae bacterium]